MPATFRTNDQDTNALARYPVNVVPLVTDFVNADGTTAKKITGGDTTVLGARLDMLVLSSDDAQANIMNFFIHDGTTLSTLAMTFVGVPSLAGTDGATFSVSALRAETFEPLVHIDNNGNPYMMLGPGWSLYAAPTLAVTATKTIQVVSWINDY